MPDELIPMTQEAYDALAAQIEELETAGRKEIAARIKTAREWGDLKENAEYHDAKNSQAHLETKILRLREQQKSAHVIEATTQTDVVAFGSRVEVRDEDSGREQTFTLVSQPDADPAAGRISSESPMAQALLGARVGDSVTFTAARTRRLTIVSIGS
jgi:transcription elongation factor GreA